MYTELHQPDKRYILTTKFVKPLSAILLKDYYMPLTTALVERLPHLPLIYKVFYFYIQVKNKIILLFFIRKLLLPSPDLLAQYYARGLTTLRSCILHWEITRSSLKYIPQF